MARLSPPERPADDVIPYLRTALLAVVAVSAISATDATASWPSFQNGGQLSFDADAAPQVWDMAWAKGLAGYGQSSPVVWDDTVYITSVSGPKKETYHVAAFRLADGRKRWQHDLINASPRESTSYASRAAPTPAADEVGLVCFFEGGNIVALTHTGDVRWERNLAEDFGPLDARHGLSASVEQSDSAAYIWVERSEDPYVLAVDKQSGKTLWKVNGIGATSWASPRLVPVDKGHHLVLSGIGSLVGLDPESGMRLWDMSGITGNSSPTPIPVGGGRFLQGATIGRGEVTTGSSSESNGVIGIRQRESGEWQAEYVWRAKRATSSFGSPIAHRGYCYFVNATGVVYCLDLSSGEERFVKRLAESTWATPIAIGDEILFFGKSGSLRSIASGEKYQPVRSEAVWEGEQGLKEDTAPGDGGRVLYGAATVGNTIITRTGSELRAWTFR